MSRRSRRRTRAARNAAQHAEHLATQAKPQAPRPGRTAAVITTGSIQASPPRIVVGGGNKRDGIEGPDPRSRGGIQLRPFADYVPQTGDWTDRETIGYAHTGGGAVTRSNHLNARQVWERDPETREIIGRGFEAMPHDREALDSERQAARDTHEARGMAADRPSGVGQIMTGRSQDDEGARHEADLKAGLYRDGLGRIVRTLDMEETRERWVAGRTASHGDGDDWRESDPVSLTCEVDEVTRRVRILEVNGRTGAQRPRGRKMITPVDGTLRTSDYAQLHGVPVQRNATQRASAAARDKAERAAAREEERSAKRAAREAAAAQRKADRPVDQARTARRNELDEAARAILARLGVANPTREHMRLAREAAAHKAQVAAYTQGR